MQSFDIHVFRSRTGAPMASATLGDGKCLPIELTEHELAVLADVATRSACRVHQPSLSEPFAREMSDDDHAWNLDVRTLVEGSWQE